VFVLETPKRKAPILFAEFPVVLKMKPPREGGFIFRSSAIVMVLTMIVGHKGTRFIRGIYEDKCE
jgi:hypothetical protein